jgi:plastocyanin
MKKHVCKLQSILRQLRIPGWIGLNTKVHGRSRVVVNPKICWFLMTSLLTLNPYSLNAATTNVSFGSFFFSPNVVAISPGDTIVWTLAPGQSAIHTVTGTGSDSFCGSGIVTSCQHTFSTAGTFPYICATPGHASFGMTGLVQVVSSAAPAPALLTNLVLLPDGQFQFTVSTTANHTNVVQAATDLKASNWVSIGTLVPGSKNFVFTDTNAPGFSLRFYRVVEP